MNKLEIVLSVILATLCGLSSVSAVCQFLDKPKNLEIAEAEGTLLAKWAASENNANCDVEYTVIFLYNNRIETFATRDTSYQIVSPGACVHVDVIVYAMESIYHSDLLRSSWYSAVPSTFGTVTNRWIIVTPTSVVITYEQPTGLANCPMVYEMVYSLDGVVVHNSTTTELLHSYNYVEDNLFCQVLYMQLTAISGGVRGEIYDNYVVTDRFVLDNIGESSNFQVSVGPDLVASWEPPLHYEVCPVYYEFRLITVADEQEVFFEVGMFYEITVNLASVNLLCKHFRVVLTPIMRGVPGVNSTKEALYC